MCLHRNDPDVFTQTQLTGQDYAGRNGADDYATVTPDLDNASVNVRATVTKPTFFAGVIGFDNVSPVADATAECKPAGAAVLPVAWSCRSTVTEGTNLPGNACAEETNPNPKTDPYNLNYTYMA
jgi:hypothetical protein